MSCSRSMQSWLILVLLVAHSYQMLPVNIWSGSSLYLKLIVLLFWFRWGVSISMHSFHGLVCNPCLDISFQRKVCLYIWNGICLLSFKFSYLHIFSTFLSRLPWSSLSLSYPTISILPSRLKMLHNPQNMPSTGLWNMLPVGAVPNSNYAYLYLLKWHTNVVRYVDFSFSLKMWYPELAVIRVRYHMCQFGKYTIGCWVFMYLTK